MPLPKYQDVLADPAFSGADVSRQREINDAYWNAYEKENPADEYGKQQRVDTTAALDAKTRLDDASPLERKALDLQRSAANYRIKARIGQKEGLTQADVDAFGAEQEAITAKQESLKKTYSMFSPEKREEVEDFWNTASQTAADGGVFGATTITSAFGEKDPEVEKEIYREMRQGFADEYGIAPEDVDSVVTHRMGLQKDPVSRDAFGTIHIKDEVLSKPVGEVESAIKASNLPESVKEKALIESPQKVALFKKRILDQVKQQHPELHQRMDFTGDVDQDYQALTNELNETAASQFGSSIAPAVSIGTKAVRGVGLFADKIIEPLRANVEAFGDSRNYALDYADALDDEVKRTESLNQLSGQINKEKVSFLGTDASVIGQGIGSAIESVTIGAATAGFGNAIVSAERIAKAGKFGKVALGFAKGVANTTPVAGYYGADQALSTYDQAIEAGKTEEEATKLAATSGAIEFGVTAFFGGTGSGGLEDIGQRLASGAVRKEVARSIWKSVGGFGKDVAGELTEEDIIAILDTIYVQSKLNPGLTTDDLKKSLYDTTVATAFATGPLAGASRSKEFFSKPTHEQTTAELHDTSDARYTEEVLPEVKAERGTIEKGSFATVAQLEQYRQKQIDLAKNEDEKQALRETSVEDLAAGLGADVKWLSPRDIEREVAARKAELQVAKEGKAPVEGEFQRREDAPRELTESEQSELDFIEANTEGETNYQAIADFYGFDIKPAKSVGAKVEATASTAAKAPAAPLSPDEQKAAEDAAYAEANTWDMENRGKRSDEWFEGGKANMDAINGYRDSLAAGGEQLQAHGMAKEATLSGAIRNLSNLLRNGLDPNRRGGRLDTAALVSGNANASGGATASGAAYSDGPFTLIAKPGGKPGQELSGDLSNLGAVIINQANAAQAESIKKAILAIRPDLIVGTASELGAITEQLLGKKPAAKAAVAPTTPPVAKTPNEQALDLERQMRAKEQEILALRVKSEPTEKAQAELDELRTQREELAQNYNRNPENKSKTEDQGKRDEKGLLDPLEQLIQQLEEEDSRPTPEENIATSSESGRTTTFSYEQKVAAKVSAIAGYLPAPKETKVKDRTQRTTAIPSGPVIELGNFSQERVDSIVESVLSSAEQRIAARELGEKEWNKSAKEKFAQRFGDWLASGKETSQKLAEFFRKIWKAIMLAGIGGVIAVSPMTDNANVQIVEVSVEEALPKALSEPKEQRDSVAIREDIKKRLLEDEYSPLIPSKNRKLSASDDASIGDTPNFIFPDFGGADHTTNVRLIAQWILNMGDNGGKSFSIADKNDGSIYFFDSDGKLALKSPALFGSNYGDVFTEEQLGRSLAENRKSKDGHITPSGRFETKTDDSRAYGKVIPVMSKGGGSRIAIHKTFLGREKTEKRQARLATETGEDNRVSLGCINVSEGTMKKAAEIFKSGGVVYVLPETSEGKDVFDGFSGLEIDSDTNSTALNEAGLDPISAFILALAGLSLSRKKKGESKSEIEKAVEEEVAKSSFSDSKKAAILSRMFDVLDQSFKGSEQNAKPKSVAKAEVSPKKAAPKVAPEAAPKGAPQAKAVVSSLLTPEGKALPPTHFDQDKKASPEQVALQNKVAKLYDALPEDDSSNPEVVQAYRNLVKDIMVQHKAMTDSGLKIEIVDGNPYASSEEMVADVKRGVLKIQATDPSSFGNNPDTFKDSNHPMLEDSGVTDSNGKPLLVNDVFRAVHDYIAHAAFGSSFGALGEEAAWKAHMATIKDPLARRALTTETRGQNSWVNYRDEMLFMGSPIKKGEPGYIAPQNRPFATQKFALLPEEAMEVLGETATPTTTPIPAQTFDPDISAAIDSAPATVAEETTVEENLDPDLETLTNELASAFGIDISGTDQKVDKNGQILLFQESEVEEELDDSFDPNNVQPDPSAIPLEMKLDEDGNAILNDKGKVKVQTVPYGLLTAPFLNEKHAPPTDTTKPDYKKKHYKITGPAIAKINQAIDSGAVDATADALVEEATKMLERPDVAAGSGWYSRMRKKLQDVFGEDARIFSHLLGTTSAKTPVENNFIYAVDLMKRFKRGEFTKNIQLYLKFLEVEKSDSIGSELDRLNILSTEDQNKIKKSKLKATLRATWFDHFDILPRQTNGSLFGSNSLPALKAMANLWLVGKVTPKTPQFAMNLNGESLEATIDVWAARLIRRILYNRNNNNDAWRIQPKAEQAVSNEDFAFAQEVFRRASEKMGMNPDDLQAIVWFGEKHVWDENGWTGEIGAFKSSFDEVFDVFFPAGRNARTYAEGRTIVSFLQAERLFLADKATSKDFNKRLKAAKTKEEKKNISNEKTSRRNHEKVYKERKAERGVAPYIRDRRRKNLPKALPESESGFKARQGDGTNNERDGSSTTPGGIETLNQASEDAAYKKFMARYKNTPSTQVAGGRVFSPIIRDMLNRRASGEKIPREFFDLAVKEHFPSRKVQVPKSMSDLPSQQEVLKVIRPEKLRKHKESVKAGDPETGSPVEVRQDVPAMTDFGVGVVTTTYKKDGESRGLYRPATRLANPTFDVSKTEKLSEKIGKGGGKGPHITIKGNWVSDQSMPKDLKSWTQVGFNPDRHSYYYERGTERPVLSGSEAFQIGNTVFVKNPIFGENTDFLYQNEDTTKGQISFRGLSQAVITLFKNADPSTASHEMAHLARRFLFNKDIPQSQREGISDADIDAALAWSSDGRGVWDRKAEEKFARGFERYLRDGVFPENSKVAELFKKISEWLQKIYKTVDGSSLNIEITPEIRALFDKLITRGETVKTPTKVAAKVVVEPKAKTAPIAPAKKKFPLVRRPETFGAKREITDAVRQRYGIPESYLKVSMSDQEAIDEATRLIAQTEARLRDPSLPAVQPVGKALVAAILEDPTRAPSKAETALLIHESIKREMALDLARNDVKALSKSASEGDLQVAVNEVKLAREALEEILNVLQLRGSRAGLALQSYKLITDRQFNLSVMEADFLSWKNDHDDGTGAKKEALTDAEVAQIEAAHKEIKKWSARVTELEATVSEAARREEALIKKLAESVAAKTKVAARKPIAKAAVKSALDFLRSRGVSVLSQGEYQGGNNLDPDIIDALATVGASYIQEGDSSLEAFSKRLNEQFDSEFKASADLILEASRAKLTNKSKKRAKTPTELSNLIDKENPKLSNRLVYNIALGFVRQGVKGKDILDSTLKTLQEDFPELTRESVAIAFTGYGNVKFPDPAADKKALRELREVERLELQLADVLKGVPALKTGQQRDKASAEARALQKQIREAYRAMGIKRAASKNQLGGSLDAMKTRLSNELRDLKNAIDTRVKLIKDKTKVQVDEEIIRLREQVAQARQDYNNIFPVNRSLTEKQQIDIANKALDRRIAEEEELVKKGLVDRITKKSKPVTAPEVEARRKKLNDLVEARRKAKAALAPKVSEMERAVRSAESTAKRTLQYYEDLVAGIKKATKEPFQIVPGEDLAKMWDLISVAKTAVEQMRKTEREMQRKSPEQIAYAARLRSLEKTVADLESRAKRGDISKKGRVLRSDSPAITELKKRAEAARAVLKELKTAQDPRTPEQKKDDALIKASKTRKAKIEARIAANDYVDTPPIKRAESKELVKARYEERLAKEKWLKNRQEWNLKNRGIVGKISYQLGSLLQFRKVVILGLDLLLFRQGIVPFLNRPIRTVYSLLKAVRAYSEANELDVYDSITNPARNPYAKYHSVAKQLKFYGPFEEGFRNKEDLPDPEILNKLAKIPGLGTAAQIMISLERINRVHFNLMANDAFNALLSIAPGKAPTKNNILLAANAAMTSVGRGSFKNQRAETGIELANYALLSTRYYVARAKLITFEPILSTRGGYTGTVKMRSKIAFQLYGKALFNTALVMSLIARGMDDDDERRDFISPTSKKFGIIKINGTSYELLGGIRPFINLLSRFVTGHKVENGEIVSLAGEDAKYKQDLKEEWTRFWQNRRNINFALLFDIASRKQFDGSPTTVKSVLTQAVLNINIKTDMEIIEKHGKDNPVQAIASIAAVHSSLNVRAEDYKPKKAKSKSNPFSDPYKSGY